MENEPILKKKLNIREILSVINIADILDKDTLNKICNDCLQQYTLDKESRNERNNTIDEAYNLVLNDLPEKNTPWRGASNISYPLIIQGAMAFNAEAYPSIIQDGNIVKGKIIGSDDGLPFPDINNNPKQPAIDPATNQPIWLKEPGEKEARGKRVAEFCNYYIMDEIQGWEENMDHLLMSLPICGTMFKKIYFDTIENIVVNDVVFSKFLIINNNAKSIQEAFSITHQYDLSNNDIISQQNIGAFSKIEITSSNSMLDNLEGDDINIAKEEDKPHTILEQHTYLDLDNDGYKEPYIITIHQASEQILRIVARYKEEDITEQDGKIIRIKPIQYFVKYSFIPSSDGSFYDIGFADTLLHINRSINTMLNQLVDAGTLSNTSQGFIGSGLKMMGGNVNSNMGQFKFINNTGDDIARNIYQVKHPEPSNVLFQLLQFLLDAGKQLSSLQDILRGEVSGVNTSATAMLAQVEQGMKQFKSIYKRIYRSLKEEINLIVSYIKEHESQEKYDKVLDELYVNFKEDFNYTDCDIVPVADPNVVTSLEKMAKANFFMQFKGDLTYNQIALNQKIHSLLGIKDGDKLLLEPQPPAPDPKIEVEMAKLEQKTAESMAKIQLEEMKLQLKAQETLQATEKKDYELQIRQMKETSEQQRVQQAQAEGMLKAMDVDTKREESIAKINLIKAQTEKTLAEAETIETGEKAENGRQDLRSETKSNIDN